MKPGAFAEVPAPAAGGSGFFQAVQETPEGADDFASLLPDEAGTPEESEAAAKKAEASAEPKPEKDLMPILFWAPFTWQLFTDERPLPSADAAVEGEDAAQAADPEQSPESAESAHPAAGEASDGKPSENSKELLRLLSPVKEEKFLPTAAPNSAARAEKGQESSGMPAAQQESMPLRSQNPNKIAAPAGQNLPAGLSRAFEPGVLAIDFAAAAPQAIPVKYLPPRENRLAPHQDSLPFASAEPAPSAAPEAGLTEMPEVNPPQRTEFSRLVDSITEHVRILRVEKSGSLDVVLRPDRKTEIFLNLQQAEGEIVVRVRLDRGNLDHFQAQWQALQQNLSSQGIKLEELEAGRGGFYHQSRSGQDSPRHERPAPIESKPAPSIFSTKQTSARPARLEQGWHRWA